MKLKRTIHIGYWQNQSTNNTWTQAEVKDLATRYDVFETRYDPQVGWIKSVNPNAEILNYRNFEAVYFATTIDTSNGRTTPQAWLDAGATSEPPPAWNEWFDFVANNVPLKDASGNYLTNNSYSNERMIDPANPWYRQYLKKYVENRIAYGYTGIFADCLRGFIDYGHYKQKPINPRTGVEYTNEQYAKDFRDLVDYIKADVDVFIVANGINQADSTYGYLAFKDTIDLLIDKVEGQEIEGCLGWTESDFNSRSTTRFEQNMQLLQSLIKKGKRVMYSNPNVEASLPFVFASYLLSVEGSNYDMHYGGSSKVESPEWQKLTAMNVGEPLGDYVRSGDIFTRQFEFASVSLNYTNKTATITPVTKNSDWNGFALALSESLTTWENALVKGDKWGFNVIRVVVRASTYDANKLEQILAKIDAHGAKAVIDNHLLGQWVDVDPKFGSQAMRDNWVNWVKRHVYDDRIIAWEIANEPFSNVWDGVNVSSEADVIPEFALITDLIREIDPNRPVVWMVPYNINPASNLRDNVVVTFHPYLYGSHTDWTTIQNILDYRKLQMRTTMNFGYSAGWIGEIETKANISVPLDLGMRYVSEIINYGVERTHGFNYWKYHLTRDDGGGSPDVNILNSIYEPPVPIIDLRVCLTYYGNQQDFSLIPDSVLDRDFKRFQNDGIKLIVLPVFWNVIETTKGTYRTEVLDRLKHITEKAGQYGINVVHNIHTWYTGTNVPSYAGNQRNAIIDSVIKQGWMDFVRKYITTLDSPNVESFQIFNELSHHSWSMNVTQDQFYSFCLDSYNVAKSVTSKTVSARWGGDGTNGMEDRFYGVFDYFCVNYYDAYNEPEQLKNIMAKARLFNKYTWVTEYGLATADNNAQAERYKSNLALFDGLQVHTAINWWWSGLNGLGETLYNVAANGIPRQSYMELMKYTKKPPVEELPVLFGLSGTPTSITAIDSIITELKANCMNVYRIAFNPVFTTGTRPFTPEYVDYLLANWDGYIIVDRNHFTDNTALPLTGDKSWQTIEDSIFDDVLTRWGNNPRIIIEIINEYPQSTMYEICEGIVQRIREAGYQNFIMNNKHNIVHDWNNFASQNPSLDVYGKHWYFNDETSNYNKYSEAIAHMTEAMQYGCTPICNTEVGAHSSENGSFTVENVKRLSDYLQWCWDNNIGNCIWMNKDLNNMPKYRQLNLRLPREDYPVKYAPIGLSSIPRQQGTTSPYALSSIDEVIAVMDAEKLPIWRMSFEPTFTEWKTYIQYYLDNCPYDLIVDYFHFSSMHLLTDVEWKASIARGLEILEYFKDYQDRIWIEPQNEQLDSNLEVRTQQFVSAVRNAGFTNHIVSNVFWRTPIENMAKVYDPLDKFWTGQHIYFYSGGTTQNWTVDSAKNLIQRGLNIGLKIVNTEMGADTNGQSFFTVGGVDMVNELMAWGYTLDVGNTVWTMYGDYDYPKYKTLGLEFPTEEPIGVIEMVKISNQQTEPLEFVVQKIVVTETPYTVASGSTVTVPVADDEQIVFK